MKRKSTLPPKPIRSPQVPVTVEMLDAMEGRLSHKIDSSTFALKAEIGGVKSELHRVALIVEEQNARNKFVLDGYAQLYELIERKLR